MGGWFLRRQGLEHLFGNLVAATGVAFARLAVFVQLSAALVPVAWSAEAVALTWLARRRRHRWSVAGALGLAGLVVLHLVLVEFPFSVGWPFFGVPLEDASAPGALALLGAVLVALALAAAIVPHRLIRSTLAGAGVLARRLGAPVRVERGPPARGLVLLVPIGLILDVMLRETVDDPALSRRIHADPPLQPATLAGIVGWCAAALYAFVGDLSPIGWASAASPAIPFTDERTLVAAILLPPERSSPYGGSRSPRSAASPPWPRCWSPPSSCSSRSTPSASPSCGSSWPWSRFSPRGSSRRTSPVFTVAAAMLMAGAMLAAWGIVASPAHLLVVVDPAPLLAAWPLAFAAVAVGLSMAPFHRPFASWTTRLRLAAGTTLVYAVSVGIVAIFQAMVGGMTPIEELAKQAQVRPQRVLDRDRCPGAGRRHG